MVARNGVTNLNKKIMLSWILLERERDGESMISTLLGFVV